VNTAVVLRAMLPEHLLLLGLVLVLVLELLGRARHASGVALVFVAIAALSADSISAMPYSDDISSAGNSAP